ncbi:MAG: type II toxin-antitoxin system VapC family toxin [Pyrinomonadaceae bacterium]
MPNSLADTNIFIAVFNGDTFLKEFIGSNRPAISTIVYLELIQGSKNKAEIKKIEKLLSFFETRHFDRPIALRSIELIRTYSKSHGLRLADAVIAATCLENDLKLITFNVKDFRFIKGLKAVTPKP